MAKPKILFIDAYDSFANNIISLVETTLDVSIFKTDIDARLPVEDLQAFSAAIVGPGPGSPYRPKDIGCIQDMWRLPDDKMLPVLGVCLGFQSLVVEFGGEVRQLPYPRHGIQTRITSGGDGMFRSAREFDAVQYHSLYGLLRHDDKQDVDIWAASSSCPDLIPLAWDQDHLFCKRPPTEGDPRRATGILNPRNILMSVKHVNKPFFGVQFHPESVCSSSGARQVILNWWHIAKDWNRYHRPHRDIATVSASSRMVSDHNNSFRSNQSVAVIPPTANQAQTEFYCHSLDVGSLTVPSIRETLLRDNDNVSGEEIVLDSEMRQMAKLGQHSIIGLIYADTLRISYSIGTSYAFVQQGLQTWHEDLSEHGNCIMTFLKSFMAQYKALHHHSDSPFFGGLMGYIDYEACLETLGVPTLGNDNRYNLCFAFVKRSIVVNHLTQRVFVQSMEPNDQAWVDETARQLTDFNTSETHARHSSKPASTAPPSDTSQSTSPVLQPSDVSSASDPLDAGTTSIIPPKIAPPLEPEYRAKIRDCQTQIRKGNSYELCLTDQTEIQAPNPSSSPWSRYLSLRSNNPAPFGAYIRLGPLTLLSSSPERFMRWTRPDTKQESTCQFRPIKGTVKKRQVNPDGSTGFVNLATATAILSTPKEQAENLMIVDLIRHDLAGVVGSGNVETKALMQVEEYESVYQLVTVIEGVLKPVGLKGSDDSVWTSLDSSTPDDERLVVEPQKTGIDVLAASLPPGSMTGAPKKRSCQLLREIEQQKPRSVYSGVLGYMDVGGGGDFSVVIRTAYRWDDEVRPDGETWRIGAGGAVTDMSEEMGEWEEMYAKLECALGLFRHG